MLLNSDLVGLCYDDVLIKPRAHDRDFEFSPNTDIPIFGFPVMASPMDTISEKDMIKAMKKAGALAVHHRYVKDPSIFGDLDHNTPIAIGTISSKESKYAIDYLIDRGYKFFVMDVAHGGARKAIETIEYIRKKSHAIIIAGNIVDRGSLYDVYNAGANGARIGVGAGAACSTRIHTGIGYPQLSAIADAYRHKMSVNFYLIADGGINNYGDVCKAFAAGADVVMTGKLFAGCKETPGEKYVKYLNSNAYELESSYFDPKGPNKIYGPVIDYSRYKEYRGMASNEARTNYRSDYNTPPEGESSFVKYNPESATDIVKRIKQYVEQAFYYVGANTFNEFMLKAELVRISTNSKMENGVRF